MKKLLLLTIPLLLSASLDNPSNLVLTPTQTSVTLHWDDNSDSETGFKIFRDNHLVGVAAKDSNLFVDRGLLPSTLYHYTIKATDDLQDYNEVVNLNSWYVYANNQDNALLKIHDTTLNKDVISLKTSNGKSIAMQLGNQWDNTKSIITWEQKVKGTYKIYLKINTTKGIRYIEYLENAQDSGLHDSEYLTIGLPTQNENNWAVITRDIEADLKRVESDNDFISIDSFLVRVYDEGRFGSIALSEPSELPMINVAFSKSTSGVDLKSINYQNREFLNQNTPTSLFKVNIKNSADEVKDILATTGWDSVTIDDSLNKKQIVLQNPTDNFFPATLKATITVDIVDKKTSWDLKIDGVGTSHSLMYVTFPQIDIKSTANSTFFTPYRYGQLHTLSSNFTYGDTLQSEYGGGNPIPEGLYPAGWRATMQYMAYYADDYGLYFGFHDEKASIKNFVAKGDSSDVAVSCDVPVPDMTKMGNSFDFPGHFELDVFSGDWFDAARIYKDWVFKYADYRPSSTLSKAREKLANISVWGTQSLHTDMHTKYHNSQDTEAEDMEQFKAVFGEDVGFGSYYLAAHYQEEYNITKYNNEYNFPKFYPSTDTTYMVDRLKNAGSSTMIYTNAYLYNETIHFPDALVPEFEKVKLAAVKNKDNSTYSQTWPDLETGEDNAIMCPTQQLWQDILKNVHEQKLKPLHADGFLLDQVTASLPVMCFDESHHHTLGGGHYWRDGYKKLINKLHTVYGDETYLISEAVNDSLMDVVDGYQTTHRRFMYPNSVPAIESVYGSKVFFIGNDTGTDNYGKESFYSILAQSFVFGNSIGFFYPWVKDTISIGYLRRLVITKNRLKNFISFGTMQKPLTIIGDIPTVEMQRKYMDGDQLKIDVVAISAIQTASWSDKDGNIVVVFINARPPESEALTFRTNFSPALYGLSNISIREISQNGEQEIGATFPSSITLDGTEIRAYIISKE